MFGINADDTSSSITCHDAAHIIWHMIHTCLDHLVKVVFVRNLASYENSVIWKDELYLTNQRMTLKTIPQAYILHYSISVRFGVE